jgi:hypothetical protein
VTTKNRKTESASGPAAQDQALAKVTSTSDALAVAGGFENNDFRGKESIDSSDVTLPFIAICQKTSPQLEPDNGKYIDGLKFTDLFNSLTSEVYSQPVEFLPLILRKHAIEFHPFKDGGGIKDRNVPWDDERCLFSDDEKPTATRFYDWAVLLIKPDETLELIVLSFKSTNISVAKQFNQIVQLRQGPAFAGKYRLKVVSAKNQYGSFGKFAITPAGRPTDEQAEFAAQVYEGLKGKNIVVEHEQERTEGDGGGADSNATAAQPTAQNGDKVPF